MRTFVKWYGGQVGLSIGFIFGEIAGSRYTTGNGNGSPNRRNRPRMSSRVLQMQEMIKLKAELYKKFFS